jgi:L-threonylcarbamoyladenylate synthase
MKELLDDGGLIVYPTSTLPGLGCLPNEKSLDLLFEIKNRDENKPVSLGVQSLSQAKELVHIPKCAEDLLGFFPRGSITIILPALQTLDKRLGGDNVAIRVFEHPDAIAIAAKMGPITATSANRAGEAPLSNTLDAALSLGLSNKNVIPGTCVGGLGSTLIQLEKNPVKRSGWSLSIMREGVAPREDVVRCWTTQV